MSDNHIDYLEQLFQGVDILIERKLKDVSFDTTIVCTITDASDSKNGRYQVTDGTIRFEAYSDSDKYKVNDQVRVSVAKGDYTDKKYIIGKYVSDNDTQPITYISPLDTVVNITGNLVPANKQSMDIIANGSIKEKLIWNTSLADARFADLQTNGIYSAITLKADFKTLLHNYNVKTGNYGLRLDLIVKPSKNSAGHILKTAYLESVEMFGNPYAFSISTQQAKIFDIGTAGIITGIALSLYQQGDFVDINGNLIKPALIGNIIVENIEIGFGSDLVAIGDNTLKAYTESDPQYKYYGHNPYPYDRKLGYPNEINKITNEKRLGLLWYNKNDLNEYLGFSDGLYDPDYDEIEYLNISRQDTRLIAQMGREGIPTDSDSLNLAANIEEAAPLITKAMKIITQDLTTTLRALRSQVEGVPIFINEIDKLIALAAAGGSDSLATIAENIDDNFDLIKAQYAGVLAHGVKTQNLEWTNNTEKLNDWDSKWDTNYGNQLATAFSNVRIKIEALLNNIIKPNVYGESAAYSGYAGIYDTYKIRLEKVLSSMEEYLSSDGKYSFPSSVFNGIDYNLLQSYKSIKTDWKSYIKKDLSQHDNKYCIYWFRYEKDFINNEIHQFLPNGWHRLINIPKNIGVPGKGEKIDGKTYNAKKLPAGEGLIDVIMRFNEPEEKYKAVLFYNHAMYESDELIFTNEDRIPETANIETGDLLIFDHIDKSRNDYQCYNLTNYLMDSADASHLRQIRVKYDGLLHGDDILPGGGIYWYVPNTATMLSVNIDELLARGFVTDNDMNPKPPYSKPGYICFYKQIQGEKDADGKWNFQDGNGIDTRDFWYKIKPYYDASASINSIKCEFRAASDNDVVTGEEFFTFGIMGSNGTKYTLSINPATNQVATLPDTPLILDVSLRDFNNEEIDLITGANGVGKTSEFTTSWLFGLSGNAPTRIEQNGKVVGLTAFGGSCGIVKASTKFQLSAAGASEETSGTVKYRTVTLETVRAIPATAGDYYISGPTSIIYNSFGTIDNRSMFDNPYKIFAQKNMNVGGIEYKANDQIASSWHFEYYVKEKNGSNTLIFDSRDPNRVSETDMSKFYKQYMPVLNDNNGLTPASLYLDNLNCYMVVYASDTTGAIIWKQPIIITQNRFASSVLNDWDGSLTIDEKNGTILSSMIGAGRKTDNNTFEGVLMGNIAIGTDSDIGFDNKTNVGYANQKSIGIYGFHDGAQSFGFNIDGTAFLGKSGLGRIIFNGNYGIIASSNWFAGSEDGKGGIADATGITQPSDAGMCIDLERGHIDAYDFRLTSDNIYFNSHPKDENIFNNNDVYESNYFFRIGNDKTSGQMSLSSDGELIIRVNSLYMTSQFGKTNLLKQTSPRKTTLQEQTHTYNITNTATQTGSGNVQVTSFTSNTVTSDYGSSGELNYGWTLDKWNIITGTLTGYEGLNTNYPYRLQLGNNTTITQALNLVNGLNYTISGYYYSSSVAILTLNLDGCEIIDSSLDYNSEPNISDSFNMSASAWHYFKCTFKANADKEYVIGFTSNIGAYLWHTQLETGTVATAWNAAPEDVEDNSNYISGYYAKYYSYQDRIFENLFTDPNTGLAMDGIAFVPASQTLSGRQELFINATYIAAGILRSQDWNGTIKATRQNDNTYTYEISNDPTIGMYINLNDGKVWAAKFELTAGTNGNRLYLNSNPKVNENYFRIGNDSNYIRFAKTNESGDTSLSIVSEVFTLKAGDPGKDITINSQAAVYPLLLGGGTFKVSWDGLLEATGATISGDITATTINVTGTGSIGNWKVTSDGNLQSANNSVILNGSTGAISGSAISGGTIYGTSISGSSITAGETFNVTSGGILTATNAELTSLTVHGTLAVKTTGKFELSGEGWISGHLKIGESSYNSDYQLYVSGRTYIVGHVGIGTTPTATTSPIDLKVSGQTWILGNVGIGTQPSTTTATTAYTLKVGGSTNISGSTTVEKDIWLKGNVYINTSTMGATGVSSNPGTTYIRGALNIDCKITIAGADEVGTTTTIYAAGFTNKDSGLIIDGSTNVKNSLYVDADATFTGGTVTFKAPENIMMTVDNKLVSLDQYIKDKGGSLINLGTTSLAYATYASGLRSSASDTVGYNIGGVNWPVYFSGGEPVAISVGSAGQVLATNSKADGLEWKTINTLSTTYGSYGVKAESAQVLNAAVKPGTENDETYYYLHAATVDSVLWSQISGKPSVYTPASHTHDGEDITSSVSEADYAVSASYATNAQTVTLHTDVGTYVASWSGKGGYGTYMRPTTLQVSTVATTSSLKYKHNILDVDNSDILYSLRPVSFIYNEDMNLGNDKRYGFIAEEVAEIDSNLVSIVKEKDGDNVALYYNSILTLAVAEIQKLRKELDDLKSNLNIKN